MKKKKIRHVFIAFMDPNIFNITRVLNINVHDNCFKSKE